MVSPAITASSPRIRAPIGKVDGWDTGWAGWPVAARSDVVAVDELAVAGALDDEGAAVAAVAAGASAAV